MAARTGGLDASRLARAFPNEQTVRADGIDPMNSSVKCKSDLVDRLREHESAILELKVKRMGVFGSFARDEATSDSDVDILVEFEQGQKTFDRFMKLSFLLEEILQRPVELVTTEALSPHLGPRILESVEYVTEAA